MRWRFRQPPYLSGVSHIMPSGNVPRGTMDSGSANPRFSDSASSDQPLAKLRQPCRGSETARHWYHLSFRTLLALVCLQVFVLLAAGFGLLISAQHKRAHVRRRDVPNRFASPAARTPAAPREVESTLIATAVTIRGQSPQASGDIASGTAVMEAASEIAELPAADLAANSATAQMPATVFTAPALRTHDETAGDLAAVPTQPGATPFKNLVMSQLRPSAAAGDLPAGPAPRSTRRATRVVNSVQQPAATDSRHRPAARKRRWDSSTERRTAGRGESSPRPMGR